MRIVSTLILMMATALLTGLYAQKTLPSVEVKTLDGRTVNIQEYANNGKITVISFWATWCSPCKKELDAIADFYADWQADFDMELVAVTVDTQRQLTKVGPLVETKGWPYIILSDANQILQQAMNFQTVPQTFIVDKDGTIVYAHSGYVPGDEYELEDKLKALAGK